MSSEHGCGLVHLGVQAKHFFNGHMAVPEACRIAHTRKELDAYKQSIINVYNCKKTEEGKFPNTQFEQKLNFVY